MITQKVAQQTNLGLELIDRQHAHFFELMNRMLVLEADEVDRSLLAEVVTEMANYVAEHFQSEESLMERYGYSDIDSHRRQHAYFTAKVEEFHRMFLKSEPVLNEEIVGFLVDWFVDHIKVEDQGYVALFKANGV